jgi:PII-like signaling protein
VTAAAVPARDEDADGSDLDLPGHGRVAFHAELQLSIFIGAGDTYDGRPLYHEIIDRARAAGLHGATAIRGLQGFGASARLHAPGLFARSGAEPVLIEITDSPTRVEGFLPSVEELIGSGLIVLRTVTTVRRVSDQPDIAASAGT